MPTPPPPSTGVKFTADGAPLPFAGNTFICHLDPECPAHGQMTEISKAFRSAPFSGKLAFLPPSSFHMTVFEGVCDQIRDKPGHWPADLGNDLSCDEVTRHFAANLEKIDHPSGFTMRPTGLQTYWPIGCAVHLEPFDQSENRKIRDYRDALSQALRLRHAEHDSYPFHSTLFYSVDWLSAEEQADFFQMASHLERRHLPDDLRL